MLVVLGAVILGLAFIPSGGSQPAPAVVLPLADEQLAASQPSRAQRASVEPRHEAASSDVKPQAALPPAAPASTTTPAQREPAPVEALPVTRLQAVSGASQSWIAQVAARTSDKLQVDIVSLSAGLAPVGEATAALLASSRIDARTTALDSVRRPDVLLLLDEAVSGASVWYCTPSQDASRVLALDLLQGLEALSALGSQDAGDSGDMPCDSLQLGRASSAVALVRLPSNATAPGSEAPRVLSMVVSDYLSANAATIRQSRRALRMTWPAIGPITSHYGPDHPLGIDIGQATGDIISATDGTVRFAGGDPCCSYGLHVIIDGPSGVTTVYGHLFSIAVHEGQQVHLGERLGVVVCTGHCTGPHLHFEVIKDGIRQNPMEYLP